MKLNSLKNIISTGIRDIYYDRSYTQDTADALRKLGIKEFYVSPYEGFTKVFIGHDKDYIKMIYGV